MKSPNCVHVANTQADAAWVSHFLGTHGIDSRVVDTTTLGLPQGLSLFHADPNSEGWQVWILQENQIDSAKELLQEETLLRKNRKQARADLGPISAACESCGDTQEYPGELRGTVQKCVKCKRFLDVGGEEEEYDWPDFDQEAPDGSTDDSGVTSD